jgi:hypothetical protein
MTVRLKRRATTGVCAVMISCAACDSQDTAPTDDLRNDAGSSAAVQVVARGCSLADSRGGGAFVDDQLIVTVAHLVAGHPEVAVVAASGAELAATVVAFDPANDLAVLFVPSAPADIPPLPLATAAAPSAGVVEVVRDGQPIDIAVTLDEYVDLDVAGLGGLPASMRRGYRVFGDLRQGDSGAVIRVNGEAAAIVFATSRNDAAVAWATDGAVAIDLVASVAEEAAPSRVDTGRC